jgi:AICAR transformylase/IMP cyclohydrolase PurH
MLDGRVKTLPQSVGISKHDLLTRTHLGKMRSGASTWWSLTSIVQRAVMRRPLEEIVENIVGGPSMIRAAAELSVGGDGHQSAVQSILEEMRPKRSWRTPEGLMEAFSCTAVYDALIASYLGRQHGQRCSLGPITMEGLRPSLREPQQSAATSAAPSA